jgi:hypothetical protein
LRVPSKEEAIAWAFAIGAGLTALLKAFRKYPVRISIKSPERRIMDKELPKELEFLRRSEDAGIKAALAAITERQNALEKSCSDSKTFTTEKISETEGRLSEQIRDLAARLDSRHDSLASRIDGIFTLLSKK